MQLRVDLTRVSYIGDAPPATQPLDWVEHSIPWLVLEQTLAEETRCMFTGRVYPAGTEVYAPVRRTSFDDPAALVPCCHDWESLQRARVAIYYVYAVISALQSAGAPPHCPLTLSDGVFAMERYIDANAAYVAVRAQEYAHTREPELVRSIASRVYDSVFELAIRETMSDPIFAHEDGTVRGRVIWTTVELGRMRAMLWESARQMPRVAPLPALETIDAAGIDEALLPRGAPRCLISEGAVVQSDAAWLIRADPRIRCMFHRFRTGMAHGYTKFMPVDMPVIAFTEASYRRAFSAPREWMWQSTSARPSTSRSVAQLCLGPGRLCVWTAIDPAQAMLALQSVGVARTKPDRLAITELPTLMEFQRITEATSRAVPGARVDIVPDRSWPVFFEQLRTINMTDALVRCRWANGSTVTLRYAQIDPGCAFVRRVTDLVVELPVLRASASARGLTMGMMLAEIGQTDANLAKIRQRLERGHCPLNDMHDMPTGAYADPSEMLRLHTLVPRVSAPYLREVASATERDHSVQDVLYARPYQPPFIYRKWFF